jgi:hypothetical protein
LPFVCLDLLPPRGRLPRPGRYRDVSPSCPSRYLPGVSAVGACSGVSRRLPGKAHKSHHHDWAVARQSASTSPACGPARREMSRKPGGKGIHNPGPTRPPLARLIAVHSRPVFADPSGRRRRLMRRAGLALAAALGVCLLAVVVAVAGGPQAPFTHWAAPNPSAAGNGTGDGRPPPRARPGTPSPSVPGSPRLSAPRSPSATASPVPTNPAGRTPSGQTKSPNPHKSSHGP